MNEAFPVKNKALPRRNETFPVENKTFPTENEAIPIGNKAFGLKKGRSIEKKAHRRKGTEERCGGQCGWGGLVRNPGLTAPAV
jgi:hypothetical protein